MKILSNKDFNRKPSPKMTLGHLQKLGEYRLHFRTLTGYTYTIGIDSELLVWGSKYNERCTLVEHHFSQEHTFEDAYRLFCGTCERLLRVIRVQHETSN